MAAIGRVFSAIAVKRQLHNRKEELSVDWLFGFESIDNNNHLHYRINSSVECLPLLLKIFLDPIVNSSATLIPVIMGHDTAWCKNARITIWDNFPIRHNCLT